jgi:hypothetical protein
LKIRYLPQRQQFSIAAIKLSALSREIIAVYSQNFNKPINTLYEQNADALVVKAGGTVHRVATEL